MGACHYIDRGRTMKKNKSKILFLVGCVLGIILSINIVYASGLKLNKSKVQLLVG